MKERVLITGAGGQLGKDLVKALSPYYEVFAFYSTELDVTNRSQCEQRIEKIRPHIIVHAAAFTAVDLAEKERERAYLVNVTGTRNIAELAQHINAKMCYISTDYVFDGRKGVSYHEDDYTNPLNVYGQTKQYGEELVGNICSKYYIVRTSWLFGSGGNNFPKLMLKLAEDGKPIQVVDDQFGSPTYTKDLSLFILDLIHTDKYGIYHATNSGSCSWYEFAAAVFDESGKQVQLEPCTSDDFPRPAVRPRYSVLENKKLMDNNFTPLRHWREALVEFLKELSN